MVTNQRIPQANTRACVSDSHIRLAVMRNGGSRAAKRMYATQMNTNQRVQEGMKRPSGNTRKEKTVNVKPIKRSVMRRFSQTGPLSSRAVVRGLLMSPKVASPRANNSTIGSSERREKRNALIARKVNALALSKRVK